jgi:hypothetical protein
MWPQDSGEFNLFAKAARWGLKGAADAADAAPSEAPDGSAATVAAIAVVAENESRAIATVAEDESRAQIGDVKGKGEQTELQTQAGSARICVSIDGVEQVLSSRGLEEGWLEETLGLMEPFLMIRHLIEGAVYKVEVEASGKCDGEIVLDSHTLLQCNAGADGDELARERTQRSGETASRSLMKEVLQPESKQQHAVVARGVTGVFGEEPGAEVR